VGAPAAVSVCVELRTGAHARHHIGAAPNCQLRRTSAVQIGYTAGRLAVVLTFFTACEVRGWQHSHWQVVTVYQRHVVEVQSAGTSERHFS